MSAASPAQAGDLITTVGGIFIVDNANVCYSSLVPVAKGQVFHHSSIPSGSAVKFAGGIIIAAGVVQEVDNMSGHYRPQLAQLLAGLTVLGANGVNLAAVRVLYTDRMVQQGGISVPHYFMYNNASTFLTSGGACAANQEGPPEV